MRCGISAVTRERSRLVPHELGLVPRLLSRRPARLADLIARLFRRLGIILKQLHWESRYLLDSFPVAVCDNIRIKHCRLAQDEDYRGKLSSKRRYFYGVRVQLMRISDGIPVEFCILPGGGADLQGLAEPALALPPDAELFVDAGYNFYEREDYLRDTQRMQLQVPRKKNSDAPARAAAGNL